MIFRAGCAEFLRFLRRENFEWNFALLSGILLPSRVRLGMARVEFGVFNLPFSLCFARAGRRRRGSSVCLRFYFFRREFRSVTARIAHLELKAKTPPPNCSDAGAFRLSCAFLSQVFSAAFRRFQPLPGRAETPCPCRRSGLYVRQNFVQAFGHRPRIFQQAGREHRVVVELFGDKFCELRI